MIRAPEQPIGWPKATAPPCTLILLRSKSNILHEHIPLQPQLAHK
jgi:hypothetical protein